MRIGRLVHSFGRGDPAGVIEQISEAARVGLHSAWLSEIYGLDALTTLAVAGRDVASIELGTAVVPTFPRHPIVLAGQALTTQAAIGGRLVLGIGPSHRVVVEDVLGYSYDRPVRHVREYLTALRALVHAGTVDIEGATLRAATRLGPLRVAGGNPFPILLAALGPRMVRLAGEGADGTVTWLAGTRCLGERIIPELEASAQAAGRPRPRVVVGLPVCVTGDEARARRRIGHLLAAYGRVPSYRALLDEERAASPADVAIVGDADDVAKQLESLEGLGITDFIGYIVGSTAEQHATLRLLGFVATASGSEARASP